MGRSLNARRVGTRRLQLPEHTGRVVVIIGVIAGYCPAVLRIVAGETGATAQAWIGALLAAILLAYWWRVPGALAGVAMALAADAAGQSWGVNHPTLGWRLLIGSLTMAVPILVGYLSQQLSGMAMLRVRLHELEKQRDEAERASRAGANRFRSMLESAGDVVVVLDAAGTVRYLSPSVEQMLGYVPAQLVGSSFFDLVHPDDAERVMQQHFDLLASPVTSPAAEFRARDASGGWLTLQAGFTNMLRDPSVAGIVVNARDVTAQARYQAHVEHLAFHDPLTGLPNRALLMDRLQQALARTGRGRGNVSVLYLDLDRFKQVNDTLGHAAGDVLLVEAAKRLTACVRPGDTVARLGGDEFAVVLEESDQRTIASEVAERIVEQLRQPFSINDAVVQIGTSVGLALSRLGSGSPAELLHQADLALYRSKASGRGTFSVFDPTVDIEPAA